MRTAGDIECVDSVEFASPTILTVHSWACPWSKVSRRIRSDAFRIDILYAQDEIISGISLQTVLVMRRAFNVNESTTVVGAAILSPHHG